MPIEPEKKPPSPMWLTTLIAAFLTLVAWLLPACMALAAEPANLVQWRPGLTSSAQPDSAYLKRAKALGYDMVINIAPPEYDGAVPEEGAILANQGVIYVNIPVAWTHPTAEDFRVFSDILDSAKKKNVLVHCQVNLRGSSFSFLYRVIQEGAAVDAAREKLTGVWMPQPTWKKFIEATLAAHGKKVEWL
ncbi:MAG: protein tyrosine phosphatase family protein [Betaproteobacteria bacterium]|nr:protein tyrosine phosphatase family protein [Betaproteobacteria bacterium]